MPCRLTLAAVVVAAASALVPPTKPLQQRQPSPRPIAAARPAAVAVATALVPTVALADFGTWISGLGTQDYVALGVLAFLVIFVIPSLVEDSAEIKLFTARRHDLLAIDGTQLSWHVFATYAIDATPAR